MTPEIFVDRVLIPGAQFAESVAGLVSTKPALQQLGTIAGQESNWTHRFQMVSGSRTAAGPARGFWQFEQGALLGSSGSKQWGIMVHEKTGSRLRQVCDYLDVVFDPVTIHRALEGNDELAYVCARLLLLSDPKALPANSNEGWSCYNERTWRPGKPHPEVWPSKWSAMAKALA